jgi:hypothetical protein
VPGNVDIGRVLRLRSCSHADWRAMFTICASCDRGQRYCCARCQTLARRDQVRLAGRRYQSSDRGRTLHRHRQQRHRERQTESHVTHQGRQTDSPSPNPPIIYQCTICGYQGRWIDPFPLIPRNLRRRCPFKKLRFYMIGNIQSYRITLVRTGFWRLRARRKGRNYMTAAQQDDCCGGEKHFGKCASLRFRLRQFGNHQTPPRRQIRMRSGQNPKIGRFGEASADKYREIG